jgi:hypothetical protein
MQQLFDQIDVRQQHPAAAVSSQAEPIQRLTKHHI